MISIQKATKRRIRIKNYDTDCKSKMLSNCFPKRIIISNARSIVDECFEHGANRLLKSKETSRERISVFVENCWNFIKDATGKRRRNVTTKGRRNKQIE